MAEKNCANTLPCTCPHTDCVRHGKCCECVAFHRDQHGSLVNCFRQAGFEVVKK